MSGSIRRCFYLIWLLMLACGLNSSQLLAQQVAEDETSFDESGRITVHFGDESEVIERPVFEVQPASYEVPIVASDGADFEETLRAEPEIHDPAELNQTPTAHPYQPPTGSSQPAPALPMDFNRLPTRQTFRVGRNSAGNGYSSAPRRLRTHHGDLGCKSEAKRP